MITYDHSGFNPKELGERKKLKFPSLKTIKRNHKSHELLEKYYIKFCFLQQNIINTVFDNITQVHLFNRNLHFHFFFKVEKS